MTCYRVLGFAILNDTKSEVGLFDIFTYICICNRAK